MANNCIFLDGAELGSTRKWSAAGTVTVSGSPPTGMSGSYFFQLTGTSSYLEKDFGANKTELWFLWRLRVTSTAQVIWTARDSVGTAIATITRNSSTKYLEARRGDYNGTIVATGTTPIELNVVYDIEIHIKPLDAAGDFEVKIDHNPVLDIDYSGDTTAGLQNMRIFRFGPWGTQGTVMDIDDVIVDDGAWIGNKKIAIAVKPTADSAVNVPQFTPSALTNWECVEELPPSDTDYNSSNTIGHVDGFVCNNMVENVDSIYAVSIDAIAAFEGSPTPTHIQLGMRTLSNNHYSADITPPGSFGSVSAIWMTNPQSTNPFEKTEIDDIELNYKATA